MKVVLVTAEEGDWINVYVDGKMRASGHSVSERDMVKILTGEEPEELVISDFSGMESATLDQCRYRVAGEAGEDA